MSGVLLIVLNEGFDDMSLLACQVILEENGNDVIISSKVNGTIKGDDSSVITVSLEEALNQGEDYKGIIVIGGNDLNGWSLLDECITKMHGEKKIIGGVEKGVEIISKNIADIPLSNSSDIVNEGNVITLLNPENVENFAEELVKLV